MSDGTFSAYLKHIAVKIGNFDLCVKYLLEIKLEIDAHMLLINQIRLIVKTTLSRK